jgi:hypothetical protein
MAAAFSPLSTQPVFYNGQYIVGAKIYVFYAGTNTPCTAYADGASNAEHTHPFLTDGNGCIPPFWVPNRDYKVVITTTTGRVIRTIDNLPATSSSSGGGGGGVLPDTGTKIPAGFLMPAHSTGSKDGWVRANGRSIGNELSGATERANEDTAELFYALWTDDPKLPVTGGRGNSPEDDFAVGKQITLPDYRGRAPVGMADMGYLDSGRLNGVNFTDGTNKTLGASTGASTVALTVAQLAAHNHSGSSVLSGSHNHLGVTVADGIHTHGASSADAGAHAHDGTTAGNGAHGHTGSATTNGSHTHSASVDTTGTHIHAITVTGGAHTHTLQDSGDHNHTLTDPGHAHSYERSNSGTVLNGQYAVGAEQGRSAQTTGASATGIVIQPSGLHKHTVNGATLNDLAATETAAGSHTHVVGLSDNGAHTHAISVSSVGDHAHTFGTSTNGSHSHSVTVANSAAHTHAFTTADSGSHTHEIVINQTGSGEAHPNMQPSILCTWYIKL